MADNKLAETLANFIPVNALNPDNLMDLAEKASVKELHAGYTLFKSGERDKRHVFLVKGSVELASERGGVQKTVYGGTPEAKHALAHTQPRSLTAKATSDVVYIEVDSDLLDIMLTWDQTGTYEVRDINDQASEEPSGDWMTHILAAKAFHRIPPANIQAMFMRLESVSYQPGDQVIEQGQDGDYFYLVKDGRCMVTRTAPGKPQPIQLAELGPGDSFGEEALISDGKRNATVTMLSSGTMMRLSKGDFMSLLNEPLLNWVSFAQAVEKHKQGAVWIDVRLPSEGEQGRIKGSINIPLIFLRMKIGSLDPQKSYITYCDTGRRSSAASFLLSERGFDVYILENGIGAAPEAALETGK